MNASVIEINALPEFLHRLFSTDKVRVSELDGVVQVEPVKEEIDCTIGLRGMLADYPEMSVDNFLARMRADAELDL
ncbi:MAG: hypothetical protein FWB88_07875 [Defluviitaleaceae bacterium]|nr:hypothetical protein [Defluviitaleaceae bacterium]MCL2240114.1 hypothetical protein [Defluviitaleaceae bacterium]